MQLINWALVRQPYNWIIIALMCIFMLIGLHLLFPQDE
jgi:hypothetical protein